MAEIADPELVEKVKVLCRSDPSAKSQWCTWCDNNMGGTKDPSRMDSDSLSLFFSEYEAGNIVGAATTAVVVAPPAQKGGGKGYGGSGGCGGKGGGKGVGAEQADLAEAVKIGQRVSPSWKAAWVAYGTRYGNGVFDPAKHTKEFLQGYLEFLGAQGAHALDAGPTNGDFGRASYHSGAGRQVVGSQRARTPAPVGGGSVGGGGQWYTPAPYPAGGPPAKRPCTGGAGVGAVAKDPEVAALAEQVRQLQKTDPVRKQQWSEFCDTSGGGVKDPMRHNLETLQQFLEQCGVA